MEFLLNIFLLPYYALSWGISIIIWFFIISITYTKVKELYLDYKNSKETDNLTDIDSYY